MLTTKEIKIEYEEEKEKLEHEKGPMGIYYKTTAITYRVIGKILGGVVTTTPSETTPKEYWYPSPNTHATARAHCRTHQYTPVGKAYYITLELKTRPTIIDHWWRIQFHRILKTQNTEIVKRTYLFQRTREESSFLCKQPSFVHLTWSLKIGAGPFQTREMMTYPYGKRIVAVTAKTFVALAEYIPKDQHVCLLYVDNTLRHVNLALVYEACLTYRIKQTNPWGTDMVPLAEWLKKLPPYLILAQQAMSYNTTLMYWHYVHLIHLLQHTKLDQQEYSGKSIAFEIVRQKIPDLYPSKQLIELRMYTAIAMPLTGRKIPVEDRIEMSISTLSEIALQQPSPRMSVMKPLNKRILDYPICIPSEEEETSKYKTPSSSTSGTPSDRNSTTTTTTTEVGSLSISPF